MLPLLLTLLGLPAHQHRFLQQLIPLWQALPGRINIKHLSRYSGWNERTLRRWMQTPLPWAELHWGLLQLLMRAGVLDSRMILALDASFIPKSGQHTAGLGMFWNGSQSRSERGLELSCLALMPWNSRQVFPVCVRQTQPKQDKADRLKQYLEQLTTFLSQRRTWCRQHLRVIVADGQYAKTMFMNAASDEGYAFVSKMQSNANLRYPFTGEQPKRRGARQRWAGKVDFQTFDGWATVPGEARERVWTRVVWAPHYGRLLRVVVIQRLDRQGNEQGHVVLCSTETTMPAERIRTLYSARFQLEFVFRDAKQYGGLNTCQLRSTVGMENHWNATFFTLSLSRAEHLLEQPGQLRCPAKRWSFSYEDVRRRAYNRLLAGRILSHLGLTERLDELIHHPSRPLDLGVKAA